MAQKVFRRILVELDIVLVIKTVFASEIRDAALCGNTGAAKENDVLRFVQDRLQLLHSLIK